MVRNVHTNLATNIFIAALLIIALPPPPLPPQQYIYIFFFLGSYLQHIGSSQARG